MTTSKPSSHWQYPKPNFRWHYFIKKKKKKGAQDYQRLAKKKYHGKILPWLSSYKKNSLGVILKIMLSYYKPMKYMDIICIATSIIYAFDTHGKHSNPQGHHLSYNAIIRNHEHYCNMEFIKVNIIYKSILKLVLLFQTLQLIVQRPIASIYEKPKNIY